jgi:very-short-patch-repair endonuclease
MPADPKQNMRGGKQVSDRAKELRRNMTDAERALWQILRDRQLGVRFRRQFVIAPFIVDFACPDAGLVVEAGQHAEPGEHTNRDAVLRQKGWGILRFWNNDVLQNRAGVAERILEALQPAQPP